MSIVLNTQQREACELIKNWYLESDVQVHALAGYAGTGKSTCLSSVIRELGIPESQVQFLTFTGRASLVLQSKGHESKTLHSFMYIVETYLDERGREQLEVTLKHPSLINPFLKLLVIDEAPMVNDELMLDLLQLAKSINVQIGDQPPRPIKILCVGDTAQLPPITQGDIVKKLFGKPLYELTENMRFGDGILEVAAIFRQGKIPNYGEYGNNCIVLPASKLNRYLRVNHKNIDVVLTTKNIRRLKMNAILRELKGFDPDTWEPQVGETVMFTANNWKCSNLYNFKKEEKPAVLEVNVINGLIGTVTDVDTERLSKNGMFEASVFVDWLPEGFKHFPKLLVDKEKMVEDYSEDSFRCSYSEAERRHKAKTMSPWGLNFLDLGYSCTIHKAQGSEWNTVLYVHEPWGDSSTRRQLAYTAATRAAKYLIVAI